MTQYPISCFACRNLSACFGTVDLLSRFDDLHCVVVRDFPLGCFNELVKNIFTIGMSFKVNIPVVDNVFVLPIDFRPLKFRVRLCAD